MKPYFVSPLFLQKLIWIPTRIILRFFGRLEVRGLENLKEIKTNVIFAANHPSELDPILIPASLPFWSGFSPMFFTTREKGYYDTCGWRRHFFGGLFIKMWGGCQVFVGLRDYAKALTDHIRIVCDGGNVCVFPEGGKTSDGNMLPAKGGVAYLAEQTGRLIVPVAISGAYNTSAIDFFLRKRKLVVHFGYPINQEQLRACVARTNGLDGNVYKQIAAFVMGVVKELVDQGHQGDVTVVRKDSIHAKEEVEHLWEIYNRAFEPVNKISPCKQSFDQAHFIEVLQDPTVRKYLLTKRQFGFIGIGLVTNDLKNTPWISEDYFQTNFPDEHGKKTLFYFMGMAIHHDFRGRRHSISLIEHIIDDLPADAIMGFDHSRNVNPMLHHFTRIVRQARAIRRSHVDRQHYHVVQRRK